MNTGGPHIPRRDECTYSEGLLPDYYLQSWVRDIEVHLPLLLQLLGKASIELEGVHNFILQEAVHSLGI